MKQGELLRDSGIATAIENADDKIENWSEMAYACLLSYPGKEFLTEDVRRWSHENGLPIPPSARAWGAVIVRAKREGVIKFLGYRSVTNPKAHMTPASYWRKL